MATSKAKKAASDAPLEDQGMVVRTATHTIVKDEQGNLISCTENESGDEVAVPEDARFLVN